MSFYVSTANFFLLHCDEWDRVVALPRHKFVTGATLLQLGFPHSEDSVENSKVVSGNYPPLFEGMHYLHNLNRFDHFFGEITIKTSDRIHQI